MSRGFYCAARAAWEYRVSFNFLPLLLLKSLRKFTALFLPAFRICTSIDIARTGNFIRTWRANFAFGFIRLQVAIHDIGIIHPIWSTCLAVFRARLCRGVYPHYFSTPDGNVFQKNTPDDIESCWFLIWNTLDDNEARSLELLTIINLIDIVLIWNIWCVLHNTGQEFSKFSDMHKQSLLVWCTNSSNLIRIKVYLPCDSEAICSDILPPYSKRMSFWTRFGSNIRNINHE